MCSPCGEEFGNNIPDGDPFAVLLATADTAFLQSAQGKSKAKATTSKHELAQKESEYTEPPEIDRDR